MDLLLSDGDICLDARGCEVKAQGTDELIQQALIRLCTRRGSFALNPSLGSTLYTLRGLRGERLSSAVFACCQQALAPIAGISLEKTDCRLTIDGGLEIDLYLKADGENAVLSLNA